MDKSLGISFEDTGPQSVLITDDFTHDKTTKEFSKSEKNPRSSSYKFKKVRNFQKLYLDLGLWPDNNISDIRTKYYKSRRKISILKYENDFSFEKNKENSCQHCKKIESKYIASKAALTHALDLSSLLMHQLSEMAPN